jgi:hypothetical protein
LAILLVFNKSAKDVMPMKHLCFLAFLGAAVSAPALAGTDLAPMALNSFTFTPARLSRAIVVNQGGQAVGIVTKVDRGPAGAPLQVEVLKPGGETMILAAGAASYDPVTNRVVADSAVTGALETPAHPRG